MKRVIFAVAAAAFLAAAFPSPGAAAEQAVSFKSGTETGSGLLVTPEGKGPFPAVIVIHEWWGLDDWVKDQARALAKEGYVALAIDLYRGKVTKDPEVAHQLMMGLPERSRPARPEGRLRLPAVARGREEGPHRRRSAGAWAASTRSRWRPRSPG